MHRFPKYPCQPIEPRSMDQQQLVKHCLKNNRVSQKLLYDRYKTVMLGVCYRYTRSVQDAEDVLQEGFIKVFTKLKQYNQEGELGAWIRRIMVTTAINHLRKKASLREEFSLPLSDMHLVSRDNPEILLNAKELAELIRQLPLGYQTIFNLHAVEGYTHPEIGEMLGITDSTSRSQYTRARVMLLNRVKNYYFDYKMQAHAK